MKKPLFLVTFFVMFFVCPCPLFASTFFEENFESYDQGSNLFGQDGWEHEPIGGVTTGTDITLLGTGSGLDSKVLNGRLNPGHTDISYCANLFPTQLNTTKIITLTFDAYAYGRSGQTPSHNSGVGFHASDSRWAGGWLMSNNPTQGFPSSDFEGWMFDARYLTGTPPRSFENLEFFDGGYDQPVTMTTVIDPWNSETYGLADFGNGTILETAHYKILSDRCSQLDGIVLMQDYRSPCYGGEIDNIKVTVGSVPEPAVIGDITHDGKIDLRDAIAALQVLAVVPPSITVHLSGDVNGDNKIGTPEVVYALRWIARFYNHAPILEQIGSKAVKENRLLSFQISGSDPDDDHLAYSASDLPPGATFDPTTKTFSWTPDHQQIGIYFITFIVADTSNAQDQERVQITVLANEPPELNPIGNRSVDENSTLDFTVTATDPEEDNLTYSASNLPNGAVLDPSTGTFCWTPTYSQSGTYHVTFTVTDDNGGSDSEAIAITVNDKTPLFKASEYFPLNVGNWWEFRDDYTREVGRSTVSGTKLVSGTITKVYSYATGYKEYYTSDSNGIKLYGAYIISDDYTGDVYFDEPLLYITNNAQIGSTQVSTTTYSFTIYVPEYGDVTVHVDLTSTTKLLGLEDVITENSILRDCIKGSVQLTEYIHETGETIAGDTTYYWFHRGVGCVKQVETDESLTITESYVNGVSRTY